MSNASLFTAQSKPRAGVKALLIAISIAAVHVCAPAFALSAKEAATVVRLIEALQEELGDFAYDEELADDWFEQDAERQGLITQAGFDETQWRDALGETYRGFLANLPETEVRKVFDDARRRLETNTSLTGAQKASVLQMTAEKERELLKWRAEGAPFARAVQPMMQRLRKLTATVPNQD